jgi:hypothetical protein
VAGKVFMDWVFIVFALETSLYAFTIVKNHMTDVRIQNTLRQTLMVERAVTWKISVVSN